VTRSGWDLIGIIFQASLTENEVGQRRTINGKERAEREQEGRYYVACDDIRALKAKRVRRMSQHKAQMCPPMMPHPGD